jgi:hypothetical protein
MQWDTYDQHPTTFQPGVCYGMDIDSFATLIKVSDLHHWIKTLLIQSGKKTVGVNYIDDYTLQLNQDNITVHVPLTATLKSRLQQALRRLKVAVFPSTNLTTLNSGITPACTLRVQKALRQVGVQHVFVCGYGLKLSMAEYNSLSKGQEMAWTEQFRADFLQNLPAECNNYHRAKEVIHVANNIFHLGATYHNNQGIIPTFCLGPGCSTGSRREAYPLLEPLTISRDDKGNCLRFGGFTVKHECSATTGITQTQVYLGPLVKALRSGGCYSFPKRINCFDTAKRLTHKLEECYEYLRLTADTSTEGGLEWLAGYRVEIVVRDQRFDHRSSNDELRLIPHPCILLRHCSIFSYI